MFTGLVQHVGVIAERRESAAGAELSIVVGATAAGAWPPADAPSPTAAPGSHLPVMPLTLGESIAVNGCCLTLARLAPANPSASERLGGGPAGRLLGFDVIHQTLRVTNLGRLVLGARVNLERSATPATLLGGHIVQGHVDGLGIVDAVLREGGEWRVRVSPPREQMRYLHDKGSVAMDGISLTVAAIDDVAGTFDVCLIPETLARTTLGERQRGDAVHLEMDCLAKMMARLVSQR